MPSMVDNSKAAQTLALTRLSHLEIAILDYDINAAQLTRKALSTIGITHTYLFRNSEAAVAHLQQKPVDILILAYESRPENGIQIVRYLRSSGSPARTLPILFTTTVDTPECLENARDAGINEFIVKPFNIRVLLERLTAMLDQPRDFIVTHTYAGPDRRRSKIAQPPGGVERRGVGGPEMQPVPIYKEMLGEVFLDSRPRIVRADFGLKQKMESAMMRMAGMENLLPQSEATRMEGDFLQWMLTDLDAIRRSIKLLESNPSNLRVCIETICKATINLRSRALPSGYTLAARVAIALHDFCQKYFNINNQNHFIVIAKHVETLQAIFTHRLTGEDNPIARELVNELHVLAQKYS